MGHHDRLVAMRKTARAVGLTSCVRQIAMSSAPLDDHTTALVARALALLGEPGYSLGTRKAQAELREPARLGLVW